MDSPNQLRESSKTEQVKEQHEIEYEHRQDSTNLPQAAVMNSQPPKLQLRTNLAQTSEGPQKSIGGLESAVTPSAYAPEVVPKAPDHSIPEVYQSYLPNETPDFADGKIEAQEEKISATADKAFTFGNNPVQREKMLAVEENGPTKTSATKPWYQRRRNMIHLLGLFLLIIVIATVVTWDSLKKKAARRANFRKSKSVITSPMAALQWLDLVNVRHYRLYFQNQTNALLEAAWDSNNPHWRSTLMAGPDVNARNGTALAAAAGWPHANQTNVLVSLNNLKLLAACLMVLPG